MIDIGADLQRAFDEGYEKGKAEMYEHMKNRLDDEYDAGYCTGKADRPRGEWIDCKEPPSTDRKVFIAYGTDNMKSVCIGHYRHDMKLWYEDKNFFTKPIYDAMYWCEIPQFPTRLKGADDE